MCISMYVSSYADFRSFSLFLSLRDALVAIVLGPSRFRFILLSKKSGPPVQPSSSCPPWFFRKRSMHPAWRVNRRKNHMFAALPSFISLISVFLRLPQRDIFRYNIVSVRILMFLVSSPNTLI